MTFESLLRTSDETLDFCKDLSALFRRKVQVDAEYAKAKLCHNAMGSGSASGGGGGGSLPRTPSRENLPNEDGFLNKTSMWTTYTSILKQLTDTALAQREMAKVFHGYVTEPLELLVKEMQTTRKQIVDENSRQTKDLQEQYTYLKKAKQAHDDCLAQLNEAKENLDKAQRQANAKEKDIDKLTGKVNTIHAKYVSAAESLQAAEEASKNAQLAYYQHAMPESMKQLFSQEEERLQTVHMILRNLCTQERKLAELKLKAMDTAIENLEQTDLTGDLEELYAQHMGVESDDPHANPVSVRSLVNPRRAGRVQKKSSEQESWKTRYLVLMGDDKDPLNPEYEFASGRLYIFESEDALKPRGIIDLSFSSVYVVDDSLFVDKSYMFGVVTKTASARNTTFFAAGSKESRDDWVAVLQQYTLCCKACVTSHLLEPVSLNEDNVERVCVNIPQASHKEIMYRSLRSLRLWIMEARELSQPESSGTWAASSPASEVLKPDMFLNALQIQQRASQYCVEVLFDDLSVAKTCIKARESPFWGDEFFFDELPECCMRLRLSVMSVSRKKRTPVGWVELDLSEIEAEMKATKKYDAWLPLNTGTGQRNASVKSPASIRIQISVWREHILPLHEYMSFVNCVLGDDFKVLCNISKVDKCTAFARDDFARSLVKVLVATETDVHAFRALLSEEVAATEDPNILFRGNSVATKAIDHYMKFLGGDYLKQTLMEAIKFVSERSARQESCEIDPLRMDRPDEDLLRKNQKRLLAWVQVFWDAIQISTVKCPLNMRETLRNIRLTALDVFSRRQSSLTGKDALDQVQYSAVSGFIFLRFFCPAILNPKLFGIWTDTSENPIASRNLTLIAKILQNLANLSDFKGKEPHMEFCNQWIAFNMDAMKLCINQFTSPAHSSEGRDKRNAGFSLGQIAAVDLGRELNGLYASLRQNLPELKQAYEDAGHPGSASSTPRGVDRSVLVSLFTTLDDVEDIYKAYDAEYQHRMDDLTNYEHVCKFYADWDQAAHLASTSANMGISADEVFVSTFEDRKKSKLRDKKASRRLQLSKERSSSTMSTDQSEASESESVRKEDELLILRRSNTHDPPDVIAETNEFAIVPSLSDTHALREGMKVKRITLDPPLQTHTGFSEMMEQEFAKKLSEIELAPLDASSQLQLGTPMSMRFSMASENDLIPMTPLGQIDSSAEDTEAESSSKKSSAAIGRRIYHRFFKPGKTDSGSET